MSHLSRAAGLLAATVAVSGLSLVAGTAPAQAATVTTEDAALTWGFSVYANDWGITTNGDVAAVSPTVATSSYDGGLESFTKAQGFTLSGGTGTVDSAGTGTIDFTGSVTYSPFAPYGTLVTDKSTVTFADFELSVESATEGELTADVSYHKPSSDLAAIRVTVATFDITTLDVDGTTISLQTATPDWAGTVPSGTYAAGYSDAWPPELVNALRTQVETTNDLSVYFYRTSTSTANNNKAPLAISAEGTATPQVTVTTASASYSEGLTLDVDGTGFTGTDGNPGDDGVYVGLAPSGGLPDVSTPEGMENFAGASWVPASGVVSGAFSTSVNAPTDALDPTEDYSIYTWRAHGHSTTSQDTETSVDIDWSQLEEPAPSSVTPGGATSKVFGATSTLTAAVPGTGNVTLTGVGAAQTKDVAGGTVSFTVPASLPVGSYTATLAYSGDASYLPSQATRQLTVTQAMPKLKSSWKNKPTTKKRGRLTVVAAGPAGVSSPSGDVTVTVSRKGVKHNLVATLVNGTKTVKLPRLGVGTWKVKLTYPGSADYSKVVTKLELKVKA